MGDGKKNLFGGGNPNFLYVPMSETEQEFLSRLVEGGLMEVSAAPDNPRLGQAQIAIRRIRFGDKRLCIEFSISFPDSPPGVPVPLKYLELELKALETLLFKERQSTVWGREPLQVAEQAFYEFAWDIAIKTIDPKIVKELMPKTVGLTSRLGNMQLSPEQRKALHALELGEARARGSKP